MPSPELITAELIELGLPHDQAGAFAAAIGAFDPGLTPAQVWMRIVRDLLRPEHPMVVHEFLHRIIFAGWNPADGPVPAWFPDSADSSNIGWLMRESGSNTYRDLHAWSVSQREEYWDTMIKRLEVRFREPCRQVLDLSAGPEHPRWLVGAKFNIVDSCFQAPIESPAVVYQSEDGPIQCMSVAELKALVVRVANGLAELGLRPGDHVAIDMPMTVESVAIYLGALAAGCPVVTVADSFAPAEIASRLKIGQARCVFTQDYALRLGKRLPLYEKVCAADAPQAIVLPGGPALDGSLRGGDLEWRNFLSDRTDLHPVQLGSGDTGTILFSSGTTAAPKAIPWDQTAPLKAAIDAHLHQDARPSDVLCWPTNMGWMMGPWLVFAALLNRATIALFYGAPGTRQFGKFVQDAGVTILGLVPSLVSAWRTNGCLDGLDWSRIRLFSSTGECSNRSDMLFLMSRAGYKPVIEYCGGTEIGGGYLTGTVVQPSAPGTFSAPALGSDLVILDENGKPADLGEVFLVPPSMGMSQNILNRDHHAEYYAGAPLGPQGQLLRRHGDLMERLAGGYFRAHGRADDSMNLGGIKVSAAQIEETIRGVAGIRETAAVATCPSGGGPSLLVIYAVVDGENVIIASDLRRLLQQAISTNLNPLFKIHDVVLVDALPRTASNKLMRRALRADYDQRDRDRSTETETDSGR